MFSRAENKIKRQKRRRRSFFAVCSFCLIVGVFCGSMLPRMLPTDNGGIVTTENGGEFLPDIDIPDAPEASIGNDGSQLGIPSDKGPSKDSLSEKYSFSLTWNVYGISSYDSLTGRLVKDADATDLDEYTTILHLDDEKKLEIQKIIDDLDIESYPDNYDPFGDGVMSKPPTTLILTIKTEKFEKTLSAEGIPDPYTSSDPKAQKFLDACYKIRDILIATDEWKSLPEYERLYE